ncbi:MAG: efflux RND transporter permease subunit, partial [Bacteroidota bacterium]
MKKIVASILAFSLRNRFTIFMLTIALSAFGVYSAFHTPIEAFPDVTNSRVQIITQWPGRSAEEVEKFVTIPIEIEMNSIPKKESLRSVSLLGLSVVTILFEDGVDEFIGRQWVANKLPNLDLPDNISPEMQPSTGPTGEIYRYTLESNTKDVRELKTIQDWVIDRHLKSVPGVADIVSFGGDVKTYEISLDPRALSLYNISALDVFEAVSTSNVNVGGDVIESNGQALVVRGIGLVNDIPEIENIIVTIAGKTPVLVKNLGFVHVSSLPNLGVVGKNKKDNVVEGMVLMLKHENPSEVLTALKEKIQELNDFILPPDVKIETFYDRSELINFTSHTVLRNLLEGITFVILIVLVF